MASITDLINRSTNRQHPDFVTPSIVAIVIDRDGNILYSHASGVGHTEDEALSADHIFWLASQSKVQCTVAALQTVEKGLIGLDDDVSTILPELAALPVLDGGVDASGIPTTKPRKNKITLRLLLSHQSGVGYDLMPESTAKWSQATGLKSTTLDSTQDSIKRVPLAFEPGTSWTYGAGIDWAGELVSRLNEKPLEEYYKENIWQVLGMSSTTFHPITKKERIVQPYARSAGGDVLAAPLPVPIEAPTETAGHGVWGSANDYVKLLGALLAGGGPILSQKAVSELFTNQLIHPETILPVIHGIYKPVLSPSVPAGEEVHHSLAGLLNPKAFEGRRSAGTLQWSGAPNLIWWIDRETGLAATAFLQLLPPGDPKAIQFNIDFEKEVYNIFGRR